MVTGLLKKRVLARLVIALLALTCAHSVGAQDVGLKTNFANWAYFGSPNASLEVRLADRWTLDIGGSMNLWKFENNMKAKHWLAQPELRYWFCETFNGHFLGLHLHGGQYNVGGYDLPIGRFKAFKDHRFQGYFYGAGLSYGYQWLLGKHWNLEASLGGGYARMWYEKFPCVECGEKLGEGYYNYWGLTRATLSLIYLF